MGCSNSAALENVTFDCTDKPKGGLDTIYVMRASDITTATDVDGELDITAVTATSVAMIDFNKKDGFSYAGTEYTGEFDGTDAFVPTVSVEIPRVTLDKLQALIPMLGGFNELVVFIKARTGIETAYGYDNGLFISAVSSTTGNNTEKNMMQLTFTGDEDSMERVLSATSWAVLEAALVV